MWELIRDLQNLWLNIDYNYQRRQWHAVCLFIFVNSTTCLIEYGWKRNYTFITRIIMMAQVSGLSRILFPVISHNKDIPKTFIECQMSTWSNKHSFCFIQLASKTIGYIDPISLWLPPPPSLLSGFYIYLALWLRRSAESFRLVLLIRISTMIFVRCFI